MKQQRQIRRKCHSNYDSEIREDEEEKNKEDQEMNGCKGNTRAKVHGRTGVEGEGHRLKLGQDRLAFRLPTFHQRSSF